jgi:prolyl-tRNA synthetase
VATPLAQKFVKSYKELPFAIYQINTKFRDELRAKSGVLRGREFRMKDMYSFHTTQEDLTKFYNLALEAYVKAYTRCGLKVKVVQASGGIFTQNVSHEFQALTDAGEDILIACPNCEFGQNSEIATLKVGDACPKCQGSLAQMKGVEVGNIFDLGTKYTDAFGMNFTAEDGTSQRVLMGCYGIGTTRLVGSIVETHHDDRGIIWPKSVAVDGRSEMERGRVFGEPAPHPDPSGASGRPDREANERALSQPPKQVYSFLDASVNRPAVEPISTCLDTGPVNAEARTTQGPAGHVA